MTAETIELLVTEEQDGERLDKFLSSNLPQYSREYLKKLITTEQVKLNTGKKIKPAFILETGQVIEVNIPEPIALTLEPETIPLDVIFEDNDMLVINKPSGLLTHPTPSTRTGTLVNALLAYCPDSLSGINGVERPGIVHRLDKETSGLMVVAKSDKAHKSLQEQLQLRTLKRTYRALVQGVFPIESGELNYPIGRNPKNREKMAVVQPPEGREALTFYQRVETYHRKYSLLQLNLQTGRTHQIRVHLAHVAFPIVGDPLYGKGLEHQIRAFNQGQVLQSFQIEFTHPVTQQRMQFEIQMDEKFQTALNYVLSL